MNPSSAGWINKFIFNLNNSFYTHPAKDLDDEGFYNSHQESGFVYGFSVKGLQNNTFPGMRLTVEDLTKINLLYSHLYVHFKKFPKATYNEAIHSVLDFYKVILKKRGTFLQKFTFTKDDSANLEQILLRRIEKNKALDQYNFTRFMTNAMVFTDVLAYHAFLNGDKNILEYMETVENRILQICFLALKTKTQKNEYDRLLIDLFETSERYSSKASVKNISLANLDFSEYKWDIEKYYFLDLCSLAVWNDFEVEEEEVLFLKSLAEKLKLPEERVYESLNALKEFAEKNSTKLHLFHYKHPVKQFYNQSTRTVKLLILRNKNRLQNELSESRELVVLLSKSTYTELNDTEKLKVKEQLLDVCKAIPSLTIFLLPGGSLLLPILIKLIPQMLPSSFNENKVPKG